MEYALYKFISRLLKFLGMKDDHIALERHTIDRLTVYDVREDELESIQSDSADLGFDFNCSLAFLTSALSIVVALELSAAPPSLQRNTVWVAVPMLTLMGLACGVRWYINRGKVSKIIQKIKARRVGPLGDEKRELGIGELESLPLQSAPVLPPAPPVMPQAQESHLEEAGDAVVTTARAEGEPT